MVVVKLDVLLGGEELLVTLVVMELVVKVLVEEDVVGGEFVVAEFPGERTTYAPTPAAAMMTIRITTATPAEIARLKFFATISRL